MAPAIVFAHPSEQGRNINNRRVIAQPGGPSNEDEDNGLPTFELRNRQLTALLVDSDRFSCMMQKRLLQQYGVQTQDVDNGQAAVDLLASHSTFSLIVIEIVLPVLDGLEVIRRIRAMGINTMIVGMSITWTERARQALLDAGADEAIEKPLSPDTLLPILWTLDGQQ